MWGLLQRLRRAGVMGINRRNAEFTLRHNPRHLYPLVDDKRLTKALAVKAGIQVPELYAVVEIERQVRELDSVLAGHLEFVLKPARGSGGDGIVIVNGRYHDAYRTGGGTVVRASELRHHVSNILSGMFSLGGHPDVALVEYLVHPHPAVSAMSYLGVPDIRIVVFLGVPIMAMVRLPTRMSEGKANLHQGAVGVGLDMATGRTLRGVWRNGIVDRHPDTDADLEGATLPFWELMLDIAARCYELTGLGYLGVDLVIDAERGPLMLEINARPGLNIQIANHAGLARRLQAVESEAAGLLSAEERVVYARERFAALCKTS